VTFGDEEKRQVSEEKLHHSENDNEKIEDFNYNKFEDSFDETINGPNHQHPVL
jgi:hypothetical protein